MVYNVTITGPRKRVHVDCVISIITDVLLIITGNHNGAYIFHFIFLIAATAAFVTFDKSFYRRSDTQRK